MRTSRQEITQVLSRYNLGELERYKTIKDGLMNLNAEVRTTKGRFVLRKHAIKQFENPNTKAESIRYEHDILKYLYQNNFSVPVPVKNELGGTFTMKGDHFFTLFSFIDGRGFYEDLFKGTKDEINQRVHTRIIESVKHLVKYHEVISKKKIKDKPKNMDVSCLSFDMLQTIWQDCECGESFLSLIEQNEEQSGFDQFVKKNSRYLKKNYKKLKKHSKSLNYRRKDVITIHADFHEGNIIYDQDQVKAVIDFDNSHTDLRQYDLIKSMYYFATINKDQEFNFDQAKFFLKLYFKNARKYGRGFKLESKDIPFFLRLDLMDTYMFCLNKIYKEQSDPTMMSMAIEAIEQLKWVDKNEKALRNL
ncbi:phosphotransferase [Candidatus Woesearchaeota archaeon]|jgi:Ser/Thr protein kinase RdoA (MazF antagonist)|nr:phosphotransferase [Candidatus Woesearchaeota archaeon]